MTTTQQVQLNPYESAALTRLAMSFCLGKGSLCLYSRSYVLQVAQPAKAGEYSRYQWRRICQFIPTAKEPRFHPLDPAHPVPSSGKGQWRLRVSSRWFETAYNLLYPLSNADPISGFRPFQLRQEALDLLGAEAIAALWADRGRLLRGGGRLRGQLNLSRLSFAEAELLARWISTLTGATGTVNHSPRNAYAPMLFFEQEAMLAFLQALRPTWMAQADCLAAKFQPPQALLGPSTAELKVIAATGGKPQKSERRRNRRVPGQGTPRPLTPPVLQLKPSGPAKG